MKRKRSVLSILPTRVGKMESLVIMKYSESKSAQYHNVELADFLKYSTHFAKCLHLRDRLPNT